MEEAQGPLETETPQEFSRRVGLPFQKIWLLSRALTHRSYLNEHPDVMEDNERLEFLGDAVLDFLVGAWLYNHYPEMAEGQLTRMRAALVGNEQLANFARQIGLGKAMRLGRGENDGGGRDRVALLGCTFEALVGALFLDEGMPAVEHFMTPLLERGSQEILVNRKDLDAKSLLQEWSQAKGYGTPVYETVTTSGPDHNKTYELEVHINGKVYGRGKGRSKQVAAKNAAKAALKSLGVG